MASMVPLPNAIQMCPLRPGCPEISRDREARTPTFAQGLETLMEGKQDIVCGLLRKTTPTHSILGSPAGYM